MSYDKYMKLAQELEKLETEYQDLMKERLKLDKKKDNVLDEMDAIWNKLSKEDKQRIFDVYK